MNTNTNTFFTISIIVISIIFIALLATHKLEGFDPKSAVPFISNQLMYPEAEALNKLQNIDHPLEKYPIPVYYKYPEVLKEKLLKPFDYSKQNKKILDNLYSEYKFDPKAINYNNNLII